MSQRRVRAVSVSLSTTALDVGLFALCTLALVGPALVAARWTCGAVGASASFVLNRTWTFRARQSPVAGQLGRYAVTALCAVTLTTALWWGLHRLTGWDTRLLHLLSLALVWLVVTFPLLRGWVFVRSTADGGGTR